MTARYRANGAGGWISRFAYSSARRRSAAEQKDQSIF